LFRGSFKVEAVDSSITDNIIYLVVSVEIESKFEIVRNFERLISSAQKAVKSMDFDIGDLKIDDHIDAYYDCDFLLKNNNYTLRKRFSEGVCQMITVKTLKTLGNASNIRIEEEAKTFKILERKMKHKLLSIFQSPQDEPLLELLANPERLKPFIILVKRRFLYKLKKGNQTGEIAFDKYSYVLPAQSNPIYELEVEGSSVFNPIRMFYMKKFTQGRWPSLVPSVSNKYKRGLEIGGLS